MSGTDLLDISHPEGSSEVHIQLIRLTCGEIIRRLHEADVQCFQKEAGSSR